MDEWIGIECHVKALSIMRERKQNSTFQKKTPGKWNNAVCQHDKLIFDC